MIILLRNSYGPPTSYVDPNDSQIAYDIYENQVWEFNTLTRTVVNHAGNGYWRFTGAGGADPQPDDFSLDPATEFFVYTAGNTRLGYFHDDRGGFTTKRLTATIEQVGSNCFGASMAQLLAVATGDYTGPFTYRWDNATTAVGRGPVPAGSYSVTLTDTPTGASVTGTLAVGQRPAITVALNKVNNDLVVTAGNGAAPYTYLWQDGVTTKDRTNVTAGTYTVTVTDANGCTSEASTRISPFRYWFSGNPIVLSLDAGPAYRADPTTKPNLSFVCEVWVERAYLSNSFELVGQVLEQPADSGGRTTFEVQELLQPFVAPVLPAVGQATVQRVEGTFCRFYLKHYERTAAGDGNVTTLDQNYLLHGGLSFTEAALGTWFSGYQDTRRPFLTWEPTEKKVLPDQPEFLYFMVPAFNLVSFRTRLRTYFVDGAMLEIYGDPVANAQRFEVYCLPAGPLQLAMDEREGAAGALVARYALDVVDEANVPLSESRSFIIDRRPAAVRRYFLYANSLGGWNTLVCRGRAVLELATKTSSSENARNAGYDPLRGDYTTNRRTGRPTLKCYTGPRSAAQLLADQDFMLSERVLLLTAGRYQAGAVKDRTFTPDDEDETRRVVQFDFELPRERYHTPLLSN